jgi:hypothetical protein
MNEGRSGLAEGRQLTEESGWGSRRRHSMGWGGERGWGFSGGGGTGAGVGESKRRREGGSRRRGRGLAPAWDCGSG